MPEYLIKPIEKRESLKMKNIRKVRESGRVMSHVWENVATRNYLHLVDVLEKTLFFVFNARAIADQIVEVVINLSRIDSSELAP